MNVLDKKKLNLLVHLSKVDGRFDKTEQELLKEFIKAKGLEDTILDEEEIPIRFSDFVHLENKIELMYWALKVMHADNVIHEKEILFCKHLALKLGFKEEMIAGFSKPPMPDLDLFEMEVKTHWMANS